MKTILKSLFLLGLPALLAAQELRQGAFFTPEQAVIELNQMAQQYHSAAEWEAHAALIRQGILDGAGISKLKFNEPVKATVHSRKIANGYSVENVFFEAFKGVFVSGNLYKPLNITTKVPAVLCPHGHGEDPRFKEYTQQRCATLARMGAIVFAYDMVGQGDMKQADHKIDNVLKAQIIMGVRGIDFLTQIPQVDISKIGVTGESGGGTQTFLLSALDKRVAVSVPVVMVSAYFYGGCVCESGLPIHVRETHATSNVEIAACVAPKPLMLVSDGGDWTKFNPEVEVPHIKRIYSFYGAEQNIENVHLPDEKHDYGPSKRQAAYSFLAKHLGLNTEGIIKDGLVDETQNTVFSVSELSVYDSNFPRPKSAVMGNEALVKAIAAY